MNGQSEELQYRLLTADDVSRVPLQWQGSPGEILERISIIGASAMMVFDGPVHVGQLQFRSYMPDTVSPNGIMDPLYWMDFRGHAPRLSEKTIALFCFHVGQIDNTPARDSHYFGRGIGISLLRNTMAWAKDAGFEALIAKGCPGYRPVIEFMGLEIPIRNSECGKNKRIEILSDWGSGFWPPTLFLCPSISHLTCICCYLTSEPLNVEPLNLTTDTCIYCYLTSEPLNVEPLNLTTDIWLL